MVGLATLCGALSYGELAARYPEAGGPYVFLREAWGRLPAFLFGWIVLLAVDPGLTAIFGVGLAGYVSYITPMSPTAQTGLALAVVLVAGLVNIRGARLGAGVLRVLIAIKVGALVALIGFGFAAGSGDWGNFSPLFAAPPDWGGALIGGAIGASFAFAGWWEVARVAGEIEAPERNLPRALAMGIGAITLLYVLTSGVFLYLVPVAQVGDPTTFAAQAGEAMFGTAGGIVFASVVILSVLGTIFAYLMGSPRLYYAMAKDGLFFRSFGELHPRYGTPHRATLIQMALASLLIMTGTFNQILGYFFFVAMVFILVIVAGLFRVRKHPTDGYQAPLYPITPLIYLVITAFVAASLVVQSPVPSLLGVAVVALGVPVYLLVFHPRPGNID